MDATTTPDLIQLQTMSKKQVQTSIADNPPHIEDSFLWIFSAWELVHMHAQECLLNVFRLKKFQLKKKKNCIRVCGETYQFRLHVMDCCIPSAVCFGFSRSSFADEATDLSINHQVKHHSIHIMFVQMRNEFQPKNLL
jgi:hypothetical protein